MSLADTTFLSGPKDALGTADVYGLTTTEVRNKITNLMSDLANDVVEGFRNGDLGIAAITERVSDLNDYIRNVKAYGDKAQQRADSAIGSLDGLVGAVAEAIKKTAGVDIEQLMRDYSDLEYQIRGVTRSVTGRDIDIGRQRSLTSLVQELVGEEESVKVVDKAASAAVHGAIYKEAIDQGMPDVFDVLEDAVDDPEVMELISRQNIERIAKTGDLANFNKVASKAQWRGILNKYPNINRTFLESYRLPRGDFSFEDERTLLLATLQHIDRRWMVSDHPQMSSALMGMRSMSKDATRLFLQSGQLNEFLVEAMIAKTYDSNAFEDWVATAFPDTIL